MNNLKTQVDDSHVGKLKAVSVDLKNLSDVVNNKVVKNTKFTALKMKVNNFDKEILHATSLIPINQYNTEEQNLEKNNWRY